MHTCELAQATRQALMLDPGLACNALESPRQFAPLARCLDWLAPR